MNWLRLFAIIVKELKQLRRDRLTAAMILGIPTIQLLLFGFAINLDVRHLSAAVVDQSGSSASRRIIETVAHSQVADVHAILRSSEAADALIRAMDVAIGKKEVTYDFARLMEGATEVKCSEFADRLIAAM